MRILAVGLIVGLLAVPGVATGQVDAVGVGLTNDGPTWTVEVTLVGEWIIEGEWFDNIGRNMDVNVHKVGEAGVTRYRVTRDLSPGEWRVWVKQDGDTLYMTAFIVDDNDIGQAVEWAGNIYLPIITRGQGQ